MSNGFNIDLPPYAYLMQVINHHPNSAGTYIELWRHKDKKHKLHVNKYEIRDKFLMAPTKFRNDLTYLVKEGLINVNETWDIDRKSWYKIDIEMVNYEEEDEDH